MSPVHHPRRQPRSYGLTALAAVCAVALAGSAAFRSTADEPHAVEAAATTVIFADDFETGELSRWGDTEGIVVEQDASAAWSARAAAAGGTAFAATDLQTDATELSASTSVLVRGATTRVSLLKMRTASGVAVSVGLDPRGRLLVFSSAAGALARTAELPIEAGRWHDLELHVSTGDAGSVRVLLDGAPVPGLSSEGVALPGPVRRLVIGSIALGRAYDVSFDDVEVLAAHDGGGGDDLEAPSAPGDLRAPLVDSREVRLRWEPSADASGIATYTIYRDGAVLRSIPGDRAAVRDTSVEPGRSYTYAVDALDPSGNRSAPSSALSVTTPSVADVPTVGAAGDIACDPGDPAFNGGAGTATACRMADTADLLSGVDVVMPLGDIQYEDGTPEKYLASYDQTWGRYLSISRPVIGNHEYESGSPDGYFGYFGAAAGDPSGGYYSYDIGSWHVVVLNSECDIVACDAASAQYRWLEADLAANPTACTLAATHRPRFTSGRNGEPRLRAMWSLLHGAGAEIVLSGHDHHYERFAPQDAEGTADPDGLRQFIVGTGGKSLRNVDGEASPNSEVIDDTSFGILRLRLDEGGYEWRFVPVGDGFTDQGSGACH